MAVGVAHGDPQGGADIGIAQGVARLVEADIAEPAATVALPLVVQRPKPVGIGDGRGVGGEDLVLGCGAGGARCAGRCVIDVGNRPGCRTGYRFCRAVAVDVAHHHPHAGADIAIVQAIGRLVEAAIAEPAAAVALPLVVQRPEPVGIGDVRGVGGEDLVLSRSSDHGRPTARCVADVGHDSSRCTGPGFGGAVAVGVAHGDPQGGADIGIVKGVARLVEADIAETAAAVALPLVVQRPKPVGIGDARGVGGDDLVFDRRAGDGRRAARRVVDVGHGRGGRADDGFCRAVAVGVVHHHPQGGADIGIAQGVGRLVEADIAETAAAVALPLVVQRPESIGIGDARCVGGEDLVLGRRADDRRRASRRVVDVGNGLGRRAGQGLCRAVSVGVAHHHPQGGADIGIAQGVARLVEADIAETAAAVALPLVVQRPEPVGIGDARGVGSENLILGCDADDGRRAGRRVVDVGDRSGRRAGQGFRRAVAVGVAHRNPQGGADVGVAQGIARLVEADIAKTAAAVALPLIVQRSEPVGIGDARDVGGENLVLGCRADDDRGAGRRVVDVGYNSRRRAGQGFRRAVAVGVAHRNLQGGADIGIAQGVGRLIEADIGEPAAAVALPLVVQRPEPVGIGDARGVGGEDLVLGCGAGDDRRAGRCVVDVGYNSRRCAGQGFCRAVAVGVAHHHPQGGADVGIAQGVGRLIEADIGETAAAVALPLVVQRPEPVGIGDGRSVGSEDLVFCRRAANGRRVGRRVVDVGNDRSRRARHDLSPCRCRRCSSPPRCMVAPTSASPRA